MKRRIHSISRLFGLLYHTINIPNWGVMFFTRTKRPLGKPRCLENLCPLRTLPQACCRNRRAAPIPSLILNAPVSSFANLSCGLYLVNPVRFRPASSTDLKGWLLCSFANALIVLKASSAWLSLGYKASDPSGHKPELRWQPKRLTSTWKQRLFWPMNLWILM
jgi:hypothetical protein